MYIKSPSKLEVDVQGMAVTVKYFAMVREITHKRDDALPLEEGATVKKALNRLSEIYGDEFRSRIYTPEEGLKGGLMLLVNGEAVDRGALDARSLKDGDVIVIMPPVGGG